MLTDGATAPAFSLPGTHATADSPRDSPAVYSLEDGLVDGPLLLNFYLFDFHPACTEHVCDLHDLGWFDLEPGVSVYGISTDRTFSHEAFATGEGLGFPLLSDSDGSVAEAYGVLYDEFQGHKRIAKRSVFLVDTDRRVRYAWGTDDPGAQPDWDEVHEAVHALLE